MSEQAQEKPTPEAPEAQQESEQKPAAQQEPPSDNSPEEEVDEAWDPKRAKAKIRRINSENQQLRDRLTQTEQEKTTSVEDLQRKLSDLGASNLRLQVGYELGLPMNLAVRLQGSTRDELVTDAEALLEVVAPTTKPTPTTARPTVALKPGATAETVTPAEDDSYPAHWLPQKQ